MSLKVSKQCRRLRLVEVGWQGRTLGPEEGKVKGN